eukprot:gene15731-biopygen4990
MMAIRPLSELVTVAWAVGGRSGPTRSSQGSAGPSEAADPRCRTSRARIGGKAWRHGGKAGGINGAGGKAWRHGGMAAKMSPGGKDNFAPGASLPRPTSRASFTVAAVR